MSVLMLLMPRFVRIPGGPPPVGAIGTSPRAGRNLSLTASVRARRRGNRVAVIIPNSAREYNGGKRAFAQKRLAVFLFGPRAAARRKVKGEGQGRSRTSARLFSVGFLLKSVNQARASAPLLCPCGGMAPRTPHPPRAAKTRGAAMASPKSQFRAEPRAPPGGVGKQPKRFPLPFERANQARRRRGDLPDHPIQPRPRANKSRR